MSSRKATDAAVCFFRHGRTTKPDFLNATVPRLKHQLKPFAQDFRIGVDFGLVNPQLNSLTGSKEHFSTPGIIAARLEAVAAPGQILVSPMVFDLFGGHYPAQFSPDELSLQGKDRLLRAYEFKPVDLQPTIELLSDFLYKKSWWFRSWFVNM